MQDFIFHFKITHPAGCFGQFINFFGENIFTLWKYVLLRRRVLFFSPPPIGVVCFRGEIHQVSSSLVKAYAINCAKFTANGMTVIGLLICLNK